MKIAVVGIGDELLAGYTVNRNASFISRRLFEAGMPVSSHRVVSDRAEAVQSALQQLLLEYDLILCTGGLGPTLDDNTRTIVADLFGMPMRHNAEIEAEMRGVHGDLPTLQDQATLPVGAIPFQNRIGTAPALLFEREGRMVVLLPGVPLEMETLLEEQLLPYLLSRFPASVPSVETVRIFQTREIDVDRVVRQFEQEGLSFGIYPRLGVVTVRITGQGDLRPIAEKIASHFPGKTFDRETLEEALHEACVARRLKVATAESCTGGAIASALTAIPGASNYFLGGVVTYSDEMKQQLLGVSPGTLSRHGAVSGETVEEMVRGLQERTGADLAVAVSGIAGPTGGSTEKPVGTVWIAAARRGREPVVSRVDCRGGRLSIIRRSVQWALAELLKLA